MCAFILEGSPGKWVVTPIEARATTQNEVAGRGIGKCLANVSVWVNALRTMGEDEMLAAFEAECCLLFNPEDDSR